ncbi:hypothetical protein [Deinococcus misasensis]|uniref:hypothetical protein n=1 Tax=Deinococcus misasensis TaxID=392413 RepID=UPI00055953CD|nr:hypothetical protein [Deinococcus misasensis]
MTAPANPGLQGALEGIQAIRERWQKATPGPWGWRGHVGHDQDPMTEIRLTSLRNGNFVMDFQCVERTGYAQPRFQSLGPGMCIMAPARSFAQHEVHYRTHINGINHPDAEAIAAAPEDVRVLLETLDLLKQSLEAQSAYDRMKNSMVTAESLVQAPMFHLYHKGTMQQAFTLLGLPVPSWLN